MFNRLFTTSVRATAFLTALAMTLGLTGVLATPSEAALKKYRIRPSQLLHYTQTSPSAEYRSVGSGGMSLIDDDGGGNPVLKKQLNGSGTLVASPAAPRRSRLGFRAASSITKDRRAVARTSRQVLAARLPVPPSPGAPPLAGH